MNADRVIKQNDLSPALTLVCADNAGPVDLAGATALFRMVNVRTGAVKVNAAAVVVPDVNFTASGATLNAPDHPFANGDRAMLKTTTRLPAPYSDAINYFVVNATLDTLQLSLTKGGAPITTTDGGEGTHTLLAGKVTYQWQGEDTSDAGTFFAEVQTTQNGLPLTYPNDRQMIVEVISDLA